MNKGADAQGSVHRPLSCYSKTQPRLFPPPSREGIFLFISDTCAYGVELIHIQRLGEIAVHSGLHSRAHILVKGVGCHSNDRHIGNGRVVQRADGPGGRIAVHHRHHDIHEHQIDETRLALRHIVRSQLAVLLPRIFKNIAKRLVNPHKKWYTFSVSRFLPAGFILSLSSRRAWTEI